MRGVELLDCLVSHLFVIGGGLFLANSMEGGAIERRVEIKTGIFSVNV